MASAEFASDYGAGDDDSGAGTGDAHTDAESKRPTVQVGDPFTEKLLVEACLELMAIRCHYRHSGYGRGWTDIIVG